MPETVTINRQAASRVTVERADGAAIEVAVPPATGLSTGLGAPLLYDDISTRPDTVAGDIGSPSGVGPAYQLTGPGIAAARVSGGKVISPTGVIYAFTDLPSDVHHYGGRYRHNSTDNNAMAMVIYANSTIAGLQVGDWQMFHPIFMSTGILPTIWKPGASNVPIQSFKQTWAPGVTALPLDGTVIQVDVWIDRIGKSAHIEVRNAATGALLVTGDGSDPLLDTVVGRGVFWEPGPTIDLVAAWAYGEDNRPIESAVEAKGGITGPVGRKQRRSGYFSRVGVNTSVPKADLDTVQSADDTPGAWVRGANTHTRHRVEAETNGYSAGYLMRQGGEDRAELYSAGNQHDARLKVNGADRIILDYAATERHMNAKFYLPDEDLTAQTAIAVYAGTGAPSNANGANGDIYLRSDGGAGTTIYHKRAGAWAGIV